MAFTHHITRVKTYQDSSGTSMTYTESLTKSADGEKNFDGTLTASTPDQAIALGAVTRANLVSVYLYSNVAVTLETNSSTVPVDTIELAAGVPVVWAVDDGLAACPFTQNVTAWYGSVAGGAEATVKIRILEDI